MAEDGKTILVCSNPDCKKQFKFATPPKEGAYSVPCPYCKTKNKFNVTITEKPQSQPQYVGLLQDGSYRFICSNENCRQSVLVPSDNVKKGQNSVFCPKCKTENKFEVLPTEEELLVCQTADCKGILVKTGQTDGIYSSVCDQCGQEYSMIIQDGKVIKVTMKTPLPLPPTKQFAMKLVTGNFFNKKEYELSKGSHYIGRLDEDCNSDFTVKDKYASKRSVKIDVNLNGESLVYKLTVKRAHNPVYHNNKELSVGDVIYITYGDTLVLGKTLIKVQKCK